MTPAVCPLGHDDPLLPPAPPSPAGHSDSQQHQSSLVTEPEGTGKAGEAPAATATQPCKLHRRRTRAGTSEWLCCPLVHTAGSVQQSQTGRPIADQSRVMASVTSQRGPAYLTLQPLPLCPATGPRAHCPASGISRGTETLTHTHTQQRDTHGASPPCHWVDSSHRAVTYSAGNKPQKPSEPATEPDCARLCPRPGQARPPLQRRPRGPQGRQAQERHLGSTRRQT